MLLRKSKIEDVISIDKIYQTAILALKNAEVDQWQNGYPNQETAKSDIDNDISYVLEEDNNILATASLFVGEEDTYKIIRDGKWITSNTNYGVIHRIAVLTGAKKQGLATQLINKCIDMAKEKSATSVRCDTHQDNKIMQQVLKKNGFVYCGKINLRDGSERIAFELVL